MWCPDCFQYHTAADTDVIHLEALIERARERRLYVRLALAGTLVTMLLLLLLTMLWLWWMSPGFLIQAG